MNKKSKSSFNRDRNIVSFNAVIDHYEETQNFSHDQIVAE